MGHYMYMYVVYLWVIKSNMCRVPMGNRMYVIMNVPMGHHTTLYMFYLGVPMGIMKKLGWVSYGALYVYVYGIPMGHQIN